MGKKSKSKRQARRPAGGKTVRAPKWTSSELRLRITYLMATTNVNGGAKVIFEHVNRLTKRGHQVQVVSHLGPPEWIKLDAPLIQVDIRTPLSSMVGPSDIVVATYWNHAAFGLHAAKLLDAVPVHFVQGDEFFYERFDDPERIGLQRISDESYQLPMKLAVVSPVIQRKLKERYGRDSVFVPATVDERVFFPRPKPNRKIPLILVMGTDQLGFKGIQDAFAALSKVRESGRSFEVVRISAYPQTNFGFPCKYVERPSQEELGRLYAMSDIMLTASHYESFPLPPLEAMASGTPVITTDNEGVHTYAEPGKNCVMVPVRDADAMAEAVNALLDSPERRSELAAAGIETASGYRWDRIIEDWERQLIDWVEAPRALDLVPEETRRPPTERHQAHMGKSMEKMARMRLESGEALHAEGDSQGANAHFQEAQSLMPDWVEPRINRAVVAWEAGNAVKALAILTEALQLSPDHPDILANLGSILAQAGEPEKALPFIRDYLAQRPDDAEMRQLADALEAPQAQDAFRISPEQGQTVAG